MVPPVKSAAEAPEWQAPQSGKKFAPIPKKKRPPMLTKEGVPQTEIATAPHSSKRDIPTCNKALLVTYNFLRTLTAE